MHVCFSTKKSIISIWYLNCYYIYIKIINFKNNKEKALEICNSLNCEYRWIRFYVDEDLDIVASIDAYLDAYTCGEMCMDYIRRIVSIVDEAYPQIAKARWA